MDLFCVQKNAFKNPSEEKCQALSYSPVSTIMFQSPFWHNYYIEGHYQRWESSWPFSFLTVSHHTGIFFTSCSIFVLTHLNTSYLLLNLILANTVFNGIKTPFRRKHVKDKTKTC